MIEEKRVRRSEVYLYLQAVVLMSIYFAVKVTRADLHIARLRLHFELEKESIQRCIHAARDVFREISSEYCGLERQSWRQT